MKKVLLFIIFFFILSGSCKNDHNFISSSSLLGEWSWVSSCGGIAGKCYTPTPGRKARIGFTADSMYYVYRNDTFNTSSRFHTQTYLFNKYPTNVITYDFPPFQQTYLIRNDTLFLNDPCCDLYAHTYTRIKTN